MFLEAVASDEVVAKLALMSPMRREAEADRLMAETWLRHLESGHWPAGELFKLRPDLWELLADVQGVTLPPPDPSWSFENPPSDASVKRRLRKLRIGRAGPGGRRRHSGRKPAANGNAS
jgi:hypothetical protein